MTVRATVTKRTACNLGKSANNCFVHKAPWRAGQPFCDNATSSNWIADDVIATKPPCDVRRHPDDPRHEHRCNKPMGLSCTCSQATISDLTPELRETILSVMAQLDPNGSHMSYDDYEDMLDAAVLLHYNRLADASVLAALKGEPK